MWVTPRAPASPHKCSSSLMDRRTSFRFGCTPSYTQRLQWFHSDHATKIIIELSLFLTGPSTLLFTLSPKLILSLCLHMTWHQVSAKMWPSSPNFYSNWYLKNSVMGYHKKLNLFCGGKKPKGNMSIIKNVPRFSLYSRRVCLPGNFGIGFWAVSDFKLSRLTQMMWSSSYGGSRLVIE